MPTPAQRATHRRNCYTSEIIIPLAFVKKQIFSTGNPTFTKYKLPPTHVVAYLMSGMEDEGKASSAGNACRSKFGQKGGQKANKWQAKDVAYVIRFSNNKKDGHLTQTCSQLLACVCLYFCKLSDNHIRI